MELVKEKLDEASENILSKLDDIIGISNNKDVLRSIIRYAKVVKKYKCKIENENYNIIIRNRSEYNLYEQLISIIAEIYYKNKIITNPKVLYMDRSDMVLKKYQDKEIEEDIIVIDLNIMSRDTSEMAKKIKDMINLKREKVFIILEDLYREGRVNALLNQSVSWAMKIEPISNSEKEKYVRNFMKSNKLVCNKEIIKEIADNPYYMVKNKLINILVDCKINNENDVEKVFEKKIKNKNRSKQNGIKELDNLIGLEDVKEQVKRIINFVKVSKNRSNMPMLHMNFTGNPGTGKTSVRKNYRKNIFRGKDFIR